MKFRSHIYIFIFIFIIWFLSHIFTISWGLPNSRSFAEDCIVPKLTLDAYGQMRQDTFKYPPLQYLIVNLFLKHYSKEPVPFFPVLIEKRSERIFRMRMVCAVMTLFTAEIIAFIVFFLSSSYMAGIVGGGIFLLNPLSLYYSHTTNMEQPYVFWFSAAFALLVIGCDNIVKKTTSMPETNSLSENKTHSSIPEQGDDIFSGSKFSAGTFRYFIHFLIGVTAALSFCTKDNVYSVLPILPVILIACLMHGNKKKEFRYKKALSQFILILFVWVIGFVLAFAAVYKIAGGYDVLRLHFSWITGSGMKGYQQASSSLSDRLFLLFKSLKDVCIALDYPMLMLFGFGVIYTLLPFLFKKAPLPKQIAPLYSDNKKCMRLILWSIAVIILTFIFIHLLFIQVTRFSHPRYYIIIVLLLSMMAGLLWKILSEFRLRLFFYIILIFQIATAWQFLFFLKNNAKSLLKQEFAKIGKLFPNVCVATTGLHKSKVYGYTNGKMTAFKTLRHFDYTKFGNLIRRQFSIIPDPVCLTLLSPNFVVIADCPNSDNKQIQQQLKILRRNKYVPVKMIIALKPLIPTLYRRDSDIFTIFMHKSKKRVKDVRFVETFKAMPLEMQLLYLRACFDPTQLKYQVEMLKPYLHNFRELDKSFYIPSDILLLAEWIYKADGRISDAEKVKNYRLHRQ